MVKNEKELYEVVGYLVDNFLDILNYTGSFPILGDFMNNGIFRQCYISFCLDDEENTDLEQVVKRISGQLPIGFCVYPDETIKVLVYVRNFLKDIIREGATYNIKFKNGYVKTGPYTNEKIIDGILINKDYIGSIEYEQR